MTSNPLTKTIPFNHHRDGPTAVGSLIRFDESSTRSEGSIQKSRLSDEGDDSSHSWSSSERHQSTAGKRTKPVVDQKESNLVWRARAIFLVALVLASAALCTVVYLVTSGEEVEDFEAQFQDFGLAVIQESNGNVQKSFSATTSLATTITSFARLQSTPDKPDGFVTVPDSYFHFEDARQVGNFLLVAYSPLVQSEDYGIWTRYFVDNVAWLDDQNARLGRPDKVLNMSEIFPVPFNLQRYNAEGEPVPIPDGKTCFSSTSRSNYAYTSVRPEVESPVDGPFLPSWHSVNLPNSRFLNNNNMRDPTVREGFNQVTQTLKPTLLDACTDNRPGGREAEDVDNAFNVIYTPVLNDFYLPDTANQTKPSTPSVVGLLIAVIQWNEYFTGILVQDSLPIHVVMENSCGKTFTTEVRGGKSRILAEADVHDSQYDRLRLTSPFAEFAYTQDFVQAGGCTYSMSVYPTEEFESAFVSQDPILYALVVLAVFAFTTIAFFVFDCLVRKRQRNLETTAVKQNAIVSSLFPENVQQQLMDQVSEELQSPMKKGRIGLKTFLSEEHSESRTFQATTTPNNKPIADLFHNTTILFADISGFTAWSSAREPSQVFTLLESLYHEFDMIAKRRRIFKVETIGDCYVAVCGLPDPRKEHAIAMAKFANDILTSCNQITKDLEMDLGPDTADLQLRVGLHSGSVVAGVLRGEKSRFQLFGDTMNTASRMESTGVPGRIQISNDTAELIRVGGKGNWLIPREDKVTAKGKGEMQTYFLQISAETIRTSTSVGTAGYGSDLMHALTPRAVLMEAAEHAEKQTRIKGWIVELLAAQLKEIAANREGRRVKSDPSSRLDNLEMTGGKTACPFEEVKEVIELPEKSTKHQRFEQKRLIDVVDSTSLDDSVMDELRDYVQVVGELYNDNPFHSLDHAHHVVLSVSKLLSRIVTSSDNTDDADMKRKDHTYGITSDPLTQFAVIFSALIHDAGHEGVSNAQLVKEGSTVAQLYNNVSVAEQNSIDMAWDLLMEPKYKNFRRCIYCNAEEFQHFWQLIINSVMATDIIDKDLKQLRNTRWDTAFSNAIAGEDETTRNNRKATIIIEHLIQASDVSHTMQHWHVYRKWNEKFFVECYRAFIEGRNDAIDPSIGWYQGELGFFDFYIIPLARKLKDCGVFGVSSDEYLNYALQNRSEWELRGRVIVEQMVASARDHYNNHQCITKNSTVPPTIPTM